VLVNHSRAFFIIKNRKQIKETGGGKKKLKKKESIHRYNKKKNQRSCKYIKILFKIFLS